MIGSRETNWTPFSGEVHLGDCSQTFIGAPMSLKVWYIHLLLLHVLLFTKFLCFQHKIILIFSPVKIRYLTNVEITESGASKIKDT